MGLKDLKSRFDRHTRQDEPAIVTGPTVAGKNGDGPNPSHGDYFSDNRQSDSPFDTSRGPKMDQMVELLSNEVKSGNTGLTYKPSPGNSENSPFQDMNGNDFGGGFTNPLTGNYKGQYINPDTDATF